jgi:hypothetical protein
MGMTKAPWSIGEAEKWEKVARESFMNNDMIIGPYLDARSVWRFGIRLKCLLNYLYVSAEARTNP